MLRVPSLDPSARFLNPREAKDRIQHPPAAAVAEILSPSDGLSPAPHRLECTKDRPTFPFTARVVDAP